MTRSGAGPTPLDVLAERLEDGTARVAVVGLGYVGLPLLLGMHRAGFPVTGIDDDGAKIALLREGRSPIVDVADHELAPLAGAFGVEPGALANADVVIMCLPTPLTDGMPDLAMVEAAAGSAAAHLRPGMLIVLESTTYPGTTEELLRPILEKSGLVAGADFALAYSPERIDPGRVGGRIEETPKIVAGITERCRDLAAALYRRVAPSVITTSSPREAEMAKLIENTYRQVNIALVNELAMVARDLDVDIWEALGAAATKPFGYQVFWPGPGVGGHCIAIDPTYLSWRASQQVGYRPGFIEHANEVNHRMPGYVAGRVADLLNGAGKAVNGARVLGVGVAFKSGVGDTRNSPGLAVLDVLAEKGADVAFHDPFVPRASIGGIERSSVDLDAGLADADVVVILTPHPGIDIDAVVDGAALVFDARGVTGDVRRPHVERL
jgi:nucleotide sugar dehydrogenase